MRTFLVTGASGFVGSHVRSALAARGEVCVGVDRSTDVRSAEFRELVARTRPDVVVHLAALSSVAESWSRSDEFHDVNVGGTSALLEALRVARPGARVLVVSSAEVYGAVSADEVPLREDAPRRPANPYADSKARAEDVALGFSDDLEVIILRPFPHTGPGQSERFVVPALAARLVRARGAGLKDIVVGDLGARRDFTDVRDVAVAYLAAADRGRPGSTYNVASGVGRTIRAVAEEVRDLIYPEATFRVDPELLRPLDTPILVGDASALRRDTQWSPDIEWSTTLRDVVDEALASVRGAGEG